MKKRILVIGLVAMVSGIASAVVVWEENFDTPVTIANVGMYEINDNTINTWSDFYTTLSTNSQLEVTLPNGGNTRGASIAIKNGLMVDTTGGDDLIYRLTFDITQQDAGGNFSMKIYDGQRDAGATPLNGYGVDNAGARWASIYPVGYGTTANPTVLADVEKYGVGTHQVFFNHDGSGDIALTMEHKDWWGNGGFRIAAVDNMVLEVIPEPATFGLLGIAGAGLLFARRKFNI